MNNRTANRLMACTVLVGMPLLVFAGIKALEKHDGWQLTAGSKVIAYGTYTDCVDAAKALGVGSYKCKDVTTITVAQETCDDVSQPQMPTIINADGFMQRPGIVVQALPNGEWGPTQQEGFVKGTWKFPDCWVLGLVPYDPEWHAPDGPPDESPSPFVYGVDPEWPIGGKCPSTDPKLCYAPPHPDIPPAP